MNRSSPTKSMLLGVMEQAARHERATTIRRPWTLARRFEASVDTEALPVRSVLELRILTGGDAGKFKFLAGFSVVGGPDVVTP